MTTLGSAYEDEQRHAKCAGAHMAWQILTTGTIRAPESEHDLTDGEPDIKPSLPQLINCEVMIILFKKEFFTTRLEI